jgi:long-chain fatty acid transport protein
MRSSGSVLALTLAALALASGLAAAGGFYVPGVGPRASAMGGAFIGLADDYSAVHWNPAGITQIEGTEVTVSAQDVISLASRDGAIRYEGTLEEDPPRFVVQNVRATSDANQRVAPGVFFYTDPGPLRGAKVGLTAYTLADFGSSWDARDVSDEVQTHADNYNAWFFLGEPASFESRVRGYVISPVLAMKLGPSLSVGIAGHALYGHFQLTTGGWLEDSLLIEGEEGTPDAWLMFLDSYEFSEDAIGWGFGATVGALYWLNEDVSFGAAVRSPITVDMEGDVEVRSTAPGFESAPQSETFDLTYPMWAGVGVAYRDILMDGLDMTLDAQWTQWGKLAKITRSVDEELPGGLGVTQLDWENTFEIGVGVDYRLTRSASLYFGYRRIPSPAPDETYDFVLPQTDKDVLSFGVGYRQDVWSMDFCLEYRLGQAREYEVTKITLPNGAEEYITDKHFEDVMVPSLSFTYGF